MSVVLSVVALVVACGALALTVAAARRADVPRGDAVPSDLGPLVQRLDAVEAEAERSLRRLAIVRYDAFGDAGGRLSWTVALLDDQGDGVLLTSIHGRSDSRSYAKGVRGWVCEQQLSPEEENAIEAARA